MLVVSVRSLEPAHSAPEHLEPGPRKLTTVEPAKPCLVPRYLSPLRYPGAKSGLAKAISQIVGGAASKLGRTALFVEPFAGGASTSLRLAVEGRVDRILLADADPLVARFWQVVASDTEWLIDRMFDEPVTLERWDYWRSWRPSSRNARDIAMKCLFLNRTTFSGILHGRAGPIGGRSQDGDYKIDCRFNKNALADRLRLVGKLYTNGRLLDVWCRDWRATLDAIAEQYPQLVPDRVIAYLDPPYLRQSPRLYGRSFDPHGGYASASNASALQEWNQMQRHYRLAEYLRGRAQYRWVLSYDMHKSLLTEPELYAAARMSPSALDRRELGVRSWRLVKRAVSLSYTVSASDSRSKKSELLITTLPESVVPTTGQFGLIQTRRGT